MIKENPREDSPRTDKSMQPRNRARGQGVKRASPVHTEAKATAAIF